MRKEHSDGIANVMSVRNSECNERQARSSRGKTAIGGLLF